jgi:hypothetical protein
LREQAKTVDCIDYNNIGVWWGEVDSSSSDPIAQGLGTFTYMNGDYYFGQYANNSKNGEGEYQYGNGNKYKGNWKEGLQHGFGQYQDETSGTIYEGCVAGVLFPY